ncbi:HNH endonuclease signature motif containing protein [Macrococcoides caseolyticum]|uniref:HNH endonuclease signature motif containing protein n=1 Tax=Macrococcoides caseolyticum TaxID=69966 RepID=UPI000C34383D|nr:HNH endonuclease signature motif containing protein [Macrococcus caseolyticus]PKE62279.1 HNH endonuclease [Macrococcus caseolyticus]
MLLINQITDSYIPEFIINNKKQKGGEFIDDLSKEDLKNICLYFTGKSEYKLTLLEKVNYGRLGILKFNNKIEFICFSNPDLSGRNSAVQHVTSALSRYHQNKNNNPDAELYYYFVNSEKDYGIKYFLFYYRMMKTVGFNFINDVEYLNQNILPFTTFDDLMNVRNLNQKKQNNSSYFTINSKGDIELFAKTYGANKKESVLMACTVASLLDSQNLIVYEMIEKDLKQLPAPDKILMECYNITIIKSDKELEKKMLNSVNNYRSPKFNMNLLELRGPKKCSLCDCSIPQIIEGAHIWPVSEIKKESLYSEDEKIIAATAGENGIWLCSNHHKLFDSNLIFIDNNYQLVISDRLESSEYRYVEAITPYKDLTASLINEESSDYLLRRNHIYQNFDLGD